MRLGIYSEEDPTSNKTWSGTPANLIEAFKSLDVDMAFLFASEKTNKSCLSVAINHFSRASAIYSTIGSKEYSKQLIEYFKKEKCDVILHAPADHLPAKKSMTRGIHTVFMDATFKQFFFPWFAERYSKRSPLVRWILKFEMERRNCFYRASLQSISHFFVATDWTQQSLINDYGIDSKKITICYTGTGNISALQPKQQDATPRLLFVARHNYIAKGAELLLSAFRLIRENHPTAELTIVGPSARDLGVEADEPQVSIHGFLPWEDLELLFNNSTLFVMPSKYEPYGLVYLEAMKCGMPVICSSTGGMASIVKEKCSGWVIEHLNPQTLATQLGECLSSLDECQIRGENGRKFVESNCSWRKCAQLIKDEMKILLSSSPSNESSNL